MERNADTMNERSISGDRTVESEAFQTSSNVGLPSQYEVNPVQPGPGTNDKNKPDAHQPASKAKPKSEPPVDRVEVSVAARALAKEITDEEPHLQLSSDRLAVMATGDSSIEEG
jgi:hypothetical protein